MFDRESMAHKRDHHGATDLPDRPRPDSPVVLNAESLFAGAREIRLVFQSEEYRLRITRNSKLILTK